MRRPDAHRFSSWRDLPLGCQPPNSVKSLKSCRSDFSFSSSVSFISSSVNVRTPGCAPCTKLARASALDHLLPSTWRFESLRSPLVRVRLGSLSLSSTGMSSSLTSVFLVGSALALAKRALWRTGMTRVGATGSAALRFRGTAGLGAGAAALLILAPRSAVSLRSLALLATFSRRRASKALSFPGAITGVLGYERVRVQ